MVPVGLVHALVRWQNYRSAAAHEYHYSVQRFVLLFANQESRPAMATGAITESGASMLRLTLALTLTLTLVLTLTRRVDAPLGQGDEQA